MFTHKHTVCVCVCVCVCKGIGYPLQYSWASLVAQMAKNPPAMRDLGSIPGWGRSPARGHDNSLQYSCLENPMERGAWRATVLGVAKRQTWLSTYIHIYIYTYTAPFTTYINDSGFGWQQWNTSLYRVLENILETRYLSSDSHRYYQKFRESTTEKSHSECY